MACCATTPAAAPSSSTSLAPGADRRTMSSNRTLAIIGASLAGAKAAEGARAAGYDGRIVLIGDEASAPYERPPLSKAVLRGEADVTSAHVHADGFYDDHAIERVVDTVASLVVPTRTLELAGGDHLTFDLAVLATGAAPRRLDLPG